MANLSLGFMAISFVLFVSLVMDSAHGSIHEYNNNGSFVKTAADALYFHGGYQGLYASEFSGVASDSSLKGKSFVRFDNISFIRTKESARKQNSTHATSRLVEAIVFEAKQRDRVGRIGNFCCSPKLADSGSCNLGEVIITSDPNDPGWPKRISTYFKSGEEEVKMNPEAVVINRTGWYTLYFMTCDPELDGLTIRGRTVWKNQGGYLPGETAPLVKFYKVMFLAYASLCLVWFSKVFRYWKNGIMLHTHISFLILFSMGELALLCSELAHLDSTGTSLEEITLWAITFSSARKAMWRLLLLFISSGYGVVKPTLGGTTLKMLLVCVLCFVISESLWLAVHFRNMSDNVLNVLSWSWAILDACFQWWIFRSLWNTLKKLKLKKRNIVKLYFYKKFANVLLIMVFLNFPLLQVQISVYGSLSELWQMKGLIDGVWYVLAYALLTLITSVWHPSEKPTRYLYVAEMEADDLSLAEAGMVTEEGDVDRNERKSVMEAFIMLLGCVSEER